VFALGFDQARRIATGLGSPVPHEPRDWLEYHPSYYAVVIRDPGGNDLEIVCQGRWVGNQAPGSRPGMRARPPGRRSGSPGRARKVARTWQGAVVRGEPAGPDGSVSGVGLTRLPTAELDEESAAWLCRLGAGGVECWAAERELHARLVRIALAEVRRRAASTPVTGPELDDVAHQAASDAMLAILAKLGDFRGESRFTTWAYRFVVLEVSSKLGKHYWRNPPVPLDAGQWERLPDRLGIDPARHAESAGILAEVRRVVDDELTAHQRQVFTAIVVDQIPLDALAARLSLRRNAIYKVIFDARRKIRRALAAKGYLEQPGLEQR
jgi:RNA polymerase sigma-70 factor, ECF subfamily